MGRSVLRSAALAATLAVVAGAARPAVGQVIVAGPTSTDLLAVLGDQLTVPIAIDMTGASAYDLGAYRVRFSWNPALFSFVHATGGTFGAPVFNTDSSAQGVVRFAAASAAGKNGIFTLGDITLTVEGTAPDTFRVAFEELTAATTFDDLLPFLTVTTGTFCGAGVWGDLDGDGVVESADAQIVLMHSVGLDVSGVTADTTTGDVTQDAIVDPRDALIILSHVAQLTVPAEYPVSQPVSAACSPGDPATVTVLPTPLTLAPGDVFGLTAQVRDTGSVLLGGKNVAWSSSDGGVATVDSTGVVTAVAAGTATITAAVEPGVQGSTSVTVGERHRWVVDPLTAQGQQDEVGSDLHPFSTIAQAVSRAAERDTVFLAIAEYNEPLDFTKPLVVVGDSGTGGMPVISTPNAPVGTIDVAGPVVLRRLAFREASEGLAIRADTVDVQSVRVESVNGAGIGVMGPTLALLDGVTVSGALQGGIAVDSAGFVRIANSRVAAIEAGLSDTTFGFGVRADTAVFDGVSAAAVDGTGIATVGATLARVRRTLINDVDVGIFADTGTRLEVIDTVQVSRARSGAVGGVVDTLVVNNVTVSDVGGAAFFLVDQSYDWMSISNVTVSGADGMVASSVGGGRADVTNSQFSDIGFGPIAPNADTLAVDGVTVDRTIGPAVRLGSADVAYVNGSRFTDVAGGGIEEYGFTSYLEVTNSVIDGVSAYSYGIRFIGDSLLLTNDTIAAVSQDDGLYAGFGGTWARIRSSVFRNIGSTGIIIDGFETVEIVDVTVDSTALDTGSWDFGARIYTVDSARVDTSRFRYGKGGALYVYAGRVLTMESDTLSENYLAFGTEGGYAGHHTVLVDTVDNVRIAGNAFLENRATALKLYPSSAGDTILVENNVIRGAYEGIQVSGWDTLTTDLTIRNNAFTGHLGGNETEQIGVGWVKTLTVQDNTFDSVMGGITDLWPADSTLVDGNTATNVNGTWEGYRSQRGRATVVRNNSVTCTPTNMVTGITHHNGPGVIASNTVSGCYEGAYFNNGYYGTYTFDLEVRGNTIEQGAATTPQRMGLHLQGGSYNARLVGNQVSGGTYTIGAVSVVGNTTYHHPRIDVDSNTVSGAAGIGIRVREADTVVVDGNTVNGLAVTETAREAGLTFANVYVSGTVVRNAVTGNGVPGIFVDASASSMVIDTNLVADNTGPGILLKAPATGTLNSIRRNGTFGIIDSSSAGRSSFPANNIEENGFGVANFAGDTLFATDTWWGDALGPQCDTGCDVASTGDSVTAFVAWSPAAADTVTGAPAGAPAMTVSPMVAAVARPARSLPSAALPATPAMTEERPARPEPTREPMGAPATPLLEVRRDGRLVPGGGGMAPVPREGRDQ